MTVSYSGGLIRQLFRWKGSVWKTLSVDVVVFLVAYYIIQFSYMFAMDKEQQTFMEQIVWTVSGDMTLIPLQFLLGFFINKIVQRWWNQFRTISWPENLLMQVNGCLGGPTFRHSRRAIARWTNLISALAWGKRSAKLVGGRVLINMTEMRLFVEIPQFVSRNFWMIPYAFCISNCYAYQTVQIRKRFPTTNHLVKAGLMTSEERELYDSYRTPYDKWWLPTLWILGQLRECQEKGAFHPSIYRYLVQEVDTWRQSFQKMLHYDWISFPLVYTQVVTVATYGYMCLCLVGRQILLAREMIGYNAPIFIPLPTILQFIFYMGWLKVGEALIDPFGEDDEDFELNWILDRNMFVGYMMVDFVSEQLPPPAMADMVPWTKPKLSHTKASAKIRETGFRSHLDKIKLKEEDLEVVFPPDKEDNYPPPQAVVQIPTQNDLRNY